MPEAWPTLAVRATRSALEPLRDAERAEPMAAYMKGVAPFLGVSTPARRIALRQGWCDLALPESDDLGSAAVALMAMREREFHYAACDIVTRYRPQADAYFLDSYVTDLLVTKPWWDTVDALVSAAVSPLCLRYDADWLVTEWSDSGDTWLIRAALTHQRGWRSQTRVPRVLELCDQHWSNPEFFVAKAIGWALRDIAALDPHGVQRFLEVRQKTNPVATREAQRGISRAAGATR